MRRILAALCALILVFGISGCAAGNKSSDIPDYADVSEFETDLNAGQDMIGKTVTITVDKLVPDSAFGYNIQTGEHLNFCSADNPKVSAGDVLTVRVDDVAVFLQSYIIGYTVIKTVKKSNPVGSSRPEKSETVPKTDLPVISETYTDYSDKVDIEFEDYRNLWGGINAFLILTNNSDVPLTVDVSIIAYDSDKNKVGAQEGTAYAVSAGAKALVSFYFDDESATSVSYEIKSAEKETFFKDVIGKISVESNAAKNKQVATVTNNSRYDVSFLSVHCLFYNGDSLVFHSSNFISDLGSGDSSTVELDCYDDYDRCEFYFDGTGF